MQSQQRQDCKLIFGVCVLFLMAKFETTQAGFLHIPIVSKGSMIVHVHIGKMAGRTLMVKIGKLYGWCSWQPAFFWGEEEKYMNTLRDHDGEPCFTSYEANWWDMESVLNRQHMFLTMLRDPLEWMFSAIAHFEWSVRELISKGCFARSDEPQKTAHICCVPNGLLQPFLEAGGDVNASFRWRDLRLNTCDVLTYEPSFPLRRLTNDSVVFDEERINNQLEHNIFGIQEYFPESLLIILYQLGQPHAAKQWCDGKTSRDIGVRGMDTKVGLHRYGDLMTLVSSLKPYQRVYSQALALFWTRYKFIWSIICQ